MNELLAKAGAAFLAPAPSAPARAVAEAPPPDLVGVLAAQGDLAVVAAGVAAELRRRHRVRAALVCAPGAAPARPGGRAARTLATRLAARDLAAVAAGGVCRVALPDDPADAVRHAWRAVAAAAGFPAVVAFAERTAEADALLAEADLLILAQPRGAAVADLAFASLAALGPPAIRTEPPCSFTSRRLALLSLSAIPLRPAATA